MKNIFYFILFFNIFSDFSSSNNEMLFSKANQYYNQGKFEEAIDNYMQILASGEESSSLFYNLANAHYKLNHVPESIYYYEKSLALNPENEDATNNLAFANQMTIDAITPLPKTWIQNFSNTITTIFSPNTWAILSILGVFFFVISFLLYYFSEKTGIKRIFFTAMLATLIFTIGTYFIADFHWKNTQNEKFAIIFDKNIRVLSEPNNHSNELFLLHEGTKIKVLESLNSWVKIKLADGKTGWINENSIKII